MDTHLKDLYTDYFNIFPHPYLSIYSSFSLFFLRSYEISHQFTKWLLSSLLHPVTCIHCCGLFSPGISLKNIHFLTYIPESMVDAIETRWYLSLILSFNITNNEMMIYNTAPTSSSQPEVIGFFSHGGQTTRYHTLSMTWPYQLIKSSLSWYITVYSIHLVFETIILTQLEPQLEQVLWGIYYF